MPARSRAILALKRVAAELRGEVGEVQPSPLDGEARRDLVEHGVAIAGAVAVDTPMDGPRRRLSQTGDIALRLEGRRDPPAHGRRHREERRGQLAQRQLARLELGGELARRRQLRAECPAEGSGQDGGVWLGRRRRRRRSFRRPARPLHELPAQLGELEHALDQRELRVEPAQVHAADRRPLKRGLAADRVVLQVGQVPERDRRDGLQAELAGQRDGRPDPRRQLEPGEDGREVHVVELDVAGDRLGQVEPGLRLLQGDQAFQGRPRPPSRNRGRRPIPGETWCRIARPSPAHASPGGAT